MKKNPPFQVPGFHQYSSSSDGFHPGLGLSKNTTQTTKFKTGIKQGINHNQDLATSRSLRIVRDEDDIKPIVYNTLSKLDISSDPSDPK